MKKYLSILTILSVITYFGFQAYTFFSNPDKALAGLAPTAIDVLGTRVGTTTTGGGFYGTPSANGTTTSILRIGGQSDVANLTFKITGASSTPNGLLTWAIFGSNDASCQTATTTTSLADTVVRKDINWFTTGNAGQITATAAVATGTVSTISNLTWDCLKVETNGSSSEAWVQIRVKDNSAVQL